MAYSSGTFSRLFDWTDDRDNGIKIRADRFDQELDGFATGLSTALLKDGTQRSEERRVGKECRSRWSSDH